VLCVWIFIFCSEACTNNCKKGFNDMKSEAKLIHSLARVQALGREETND